MSRVVVDRLLIVTPQEFANPEAFARNVHNRSATFERPFFCLSWDGWPESLISSELFGHVRGAFYGAFRDYAGALARAHGGTLYIERIDRMPPDVVRHLLRAMDVGRATRLGDPEHEYPVHVRLIATATTRPEGDCGEMLERFLAADAP